MRAKFNFSLLVLLCLFLNCTNNTDTASLSDGNEGQAFAKQSVAPTFEKIDVEAQTLTVKGEGAQTLLLSSGSSIDVPAAAFVDADGNPVQGDVNLVFREFHNAAEIISSGIPMKVMGENGEEGWMQTAGMYEINGSHNGQPVFVAPGKSLNVNLLSEVGGEYGFWNFDEETGNWDNLGISNPAPVQDVAGEKSAADAVRKAGPAPVPPVAYDGKTPPIDLDVNLKNFPELADKQSIVWQYAGKDPKQDPARNPSIFQNQWDEIGLKADANGHTYTLTLRNDDQSISLPVVPALKGKDLEKALADYQLKLAGYKAKLASFAETDNFRKQQERFVRSFQVQGFGIYNYDILMKLNNTVPLLANFDFGTDIPQNIRKDISVFLVAQGGKMVVRFPASDWKRFRIDPSLDNSLVAVLPGNKIATLSNEELKKMMPQIKEAAGRDFIFNMRMETESVRSVKDMEGRLAAL